VLSGELVFLLDVDNTLLDNDRFAADLGDRVQQAFGAAQRERYWRIFAELRASLGRADYLETLQVFRAGLDGDPQLLEMSNFLLEYPFADRLFPQALAAVAHLNKFGRTVVLSDGDIVYQPRKIHRSGIWDAVAGRVLIYVHKELMLDQMRQRYAAAHYVMVDDKPNLLAAMKRVLGGTLTTVFVRQGHYAQQPESAGVEPAPDRVIDKIADLLTFSQSDFQVTA
jgi:FMN phosphatase YigB (HAD superfamily)